MDIYRPVLDGGEGRAIIADREIYVQPNRIVAELLDHMVPRCLRWISSDRQGFPRRLQQFLTSLGRMLMYDLVDAVTATIRLWLPFGRCTGGSESSLRREPAAIQRCQHGYQPSDPCERGGGSRDSPAAPGLLLANGSGARDLARGTGLVGANAYAGGPPSTVGVDSGADQPRQRQNDPSRPLACSCLCMCQFMPPAPLRSQLPW